MSLEFSDIKLKVIDKEWGPHVAVPPSVINKQNVDDPNLWGNIYD
jgi:hypothetical protein